MEEREDVFAERKGGETFNCKELEMDQNNMSQDGINLADDLISRTLVQLKLVVVGC